MSSKEFKTFDMPWEKVYGYVQSVKSGDTVWISGQLGHDMEGNLAEGMENQFRQTYQNISRLLSAFGLNTGHITEEVIYVTNMQEGFAGRQILGKEFYGDSCIVASTIVGVTELALPGQKVEIKITAKV
ncbi:Rid family hydrolase [Chryseobacterium flavum]|uniref:Rid family hydrolase n=1 Tax=Chryseobacterium flavum TaxID=415851 RepID=UPI0028AA63BD|nr:Rid family hydrolase [Chryseobacterium flavum]